MKAMQKIVPVIALIAVGSIAATPARAEGYPRYAGTYLTDVELIQIGDFDCQFLKDLGFIDTCIGRALFSLHAGGTLESNDQSDFIDGFDGVALGRWTRQGFRSSTVTTRTVSLNYDVDGQLEGYLVRELEITFDASKTTFSGTGATKVYGADQDPLDPAAIPNVVTTQSVTGREVR